MVVDEHLFLTGPDDAIGIESGGIDPRSTSLR